MHVGKSKIYITSKSYNVYVPSVAAVSVVSSADTVVTSVAPVAASKERIKCVLYIKPSPSSILWANTKYYQLNCKANSRIIQ